MISKQYILVGAICALCLIILPACGNEEDPKVTVTATAALATFRSVAEENHKPVIMGGRDAVRNFYPNPYFYEAYVDGQKAEGVIVRHPATILFYGKDLNSSDSAKLVDDAEVASCAMGTPAGGVPLATELIITEGGTRASWDIKITKAGSYLVCYYNAEHNNWLEVMGRNGRPIPDDDSDDNKKDDDNDHKDDDDNGGTDEDAGTTAAPSEDPQCPHLPHNETLVHYEAIKATVKQSNPLNLTEMTETISKVLCLHPNDIATLRVSNEGKYQYWYFSIICRGCGFVERTNYLVKRGLSDHAEALKEAGITAIEGLSKMPLDVHKDVKIDRSLYIIFLTSLFFLAGGGLFIFGVMKYKERQEYFEGVDHRFGLVDGDIEDLFPPEDIGYAMRTDDDNINHSVDAFIEVEE